LEVAPDTVSALADAVHRIPWWIAAVLWVTAWTAFSVGGLLATRGMVGRMWREQERDDRNDIVGFFLGGISVFYGLALGLIAVASWQNYSDVSSRVSDEAATLAALKSDVHSFVSPLNDSLYANLDRYAEFTVDQAWPAQARGLVARGDTLFLRPFRVKLNAYNPDGSGQINLQSEAMRRFNDVLRLRRLRQDSVTAGLSIAVWCVLLFGGVLTIAITWLFVITPQRAHVLLNAILATVIGLLIFLIGAMDHPFRGSLRVTCEPFIAHGAHAHGIGEAGGKKKAEANECAP
jgi:hypothetical protein